MSMAILIKGNGKMAFSMVKEHIFMAVKIPKNTSVNINKGSSMVKEDTLILMEESLKVFGNLEKGKVRARFLTKMK